MHCNYGIGKPIFKELSRLPGLSQTQSVHVFVSFQGRSCILYVIGGSAIVFFPDPDRAKTEFILL